MPAGGVPGLLKKALVEALLEWHRDNRRDYPWRRCGDPFRVLVAEVMLQRTRADQVEEVFTRFFEEFPDPSAAASADREKLERLLAPLGLRHRARRMGRLLSELLERHGGRIPDDYDELLKLPGVGPYTASAVLCFAFGRRIPIVDANVARFYVRFFGVEPRGRPHRDPEVLRLAEECLPEGRAREYNEALLDFAALVCGPTPRCGSCPLRELCRYARASGGVREPD
ncbi:MAG: A/G-specific adenine glycosylase [Candidatus Korarchaeota archaeon]|nr:A/G-specific adenine glycosylase [Candidatus Korarchaeota archaeon]